MLGAPTRRCPLPGWCRLHSGTTRQLGEGVFSVLSNVAWVPSLGVGVAVRPGSMGTVWLGGGGLGRYKSEWKSCLEASRMATWTGESCGRSLTEDHQQTSPIYPPAPIFTHSRIQPSDFLITDYVSLLQLLPAAWAFRSQALVRISKHFRELA